MKNKIIWITLSFLIVISLVQISCSTKTSTTPATTQPGTNTNTTVSNGNSTTKTSTQTEANWWDKFGEPQYGGTLTTRIASMDSVRIDPWQAGSGEEVPLFETLFAHNWTTDRKTFSFQFGFVPLEYMEGMLAESWEKTGTLTVVVHLRKGIHWQNKAPLNGREFTADDVIFNYDRFLGTGNGYTEPNPFLAGMVAYTEKVTKIDKYTVQFTFKSSTALATYDVMVPQVQFAAPEWVKLYGATQFIMPGPPGGGPPGGPPGGGPPGGPPPSSDVQPSGGNTNSATVRTESADWKTAVGTGAWLITDFTSGSSVTLNKNPDYWGYDKRHPQNKLPYIDTFKEVVIPDTSTAIAALRTGKVDMLTGWISGVTSQQAQSLLNTNPDIQESMLSTEQISVEMTCDKAPFNDIRVRKALEMAIDRKAIARSIYGNGVTGVPCGLVNPNYNGWCTPYDQWPTEIQQEYSYNPELAKKLLSDAGYPQGFSTSVITSSGGETIQAIQSYFKDINVNMEIKVMDMWTAMDYLVSGKHDGMSLGRTADVLSPWQAISVRLTGNRQNYTFNNDSTFDAMYQKIIAATDENETRQLMKDLDIYAIQQHWSVNLFCSAVPQLWQSYIKGYSGERIGYNSRDVSRWWIDQTLKK